jgi:bacterioferritin (cytochrome b1)
MTEAQKKKLHKKLVESLEKLEGRIASYKKTEKKYDPKEFIKTTEILEAERLETWRMIVQLEHELRIESETKPLSKDELERKITDLEEQIDKLEGQVELIEVGREWKGADEFENFPEVIALEAKIEKLEKQAQKLRDLLIDK